VTLLLAAWTAISAAGGDRLGLSPQTMAWMGILSRRAGHAAGVLAPAPEDAISKQQVVQQVQLARRLTHVAHQSQHPAYPPATSRLSATRPPLSPAPPSPRRSRRPENERLPHELPVAGPALEVPPLRPDPQVVRLPSRLHVGHPLAGPAPRQQQVLAGRVALVRPHFYAPDGSKQTWLGKDGFFVDPENDTKFDRAWLLHIRRNKHHPQHWVRVWSAACQCMEIPLSILSQLGFPPRDAS
jgi:hypothetical protein